MIQRELWLPTQAAQSLPPAAASALPSLPQEILSVFDASVGTPLRQPVNPNAPFTLKTWRQNLL